MGREDIKVFIVGDETGFVRSLARASTAASAFGKTLTTAGQNASRLGSTLTRDLTLPIVGIGVAAVKMSADFHHSMLMIQTQAGASAAEMKKMSAAVLELAKSTEQGPTQLSQALFMLESRGLRGAEALKTLKMASQGAAVGGADLTDVANALGSAVVTGIKGVQDYAQAMGTVNATVGAGAMHMQDLAQAFGTGILPTAHAAGLSLSEVGAALAVMTDRGMNADEAATRLRMTIGMMESPSKAAEKALADMGISATELANALKGPGGFGAALQILHDQMGKLGNSTRATQDLMSAFGKGRSSAAVVTLVQSLTSSISDYNGKLDQIRQTSGQFNADVAAEAETTTHKLKVAWSSVQVSMIDLGAIIAPAAAKIAGALAHVAEWFDRLSPATKKWLAISLGALAVVGPLLKIEGALLKIGGAVVQLASTWMLNFRKIQSATAATEAEGTGFFASMRAGAIATATTIKVALIETGIGALMVAMGLAAGYIITHWQKVKVWLTEFGFWLRETADKFALAFLEPFSHLPGQMGAWARDAKDRIIGQLTELSDAAASLGHATGQNWGAGFDAGIGQSLAPFGGAPSFAGQYVYHPRPMDLSVYAERASGPGFSGARERAPGAADALRQQIAAALSKAAAGAAEAGGGVPIGSSGGSGSKKKGTSAATRLARALAAATKQSAAAGHALGGALREGVPWMLDPSLTRGLQEQQASLEAANKDEVAEFTKRQKEIAAEAKAAQKAWITGLFPDSLQTRLSALTRKLKSDSALQATAVGDAAKLGNDNILADLQGQERIITDEGASLKAKLVGALPWQRAAVQKELAKVNAQLASVQDQVLKSLQTTVQTLQNQVSTSFSSVRSEIDAAFQAQTQGMLDAVAKRDYQQGAKTPLEQQLAAMQAADRVQSFTDAISRAQQKLAADEGKGAPPATLAADQKALDAANRAYQEYQLQIQAAAERARVDADYAAQTKKIQADRQAAENAMNAQLAKLSVSLQNGTGTVSALTQIAAAYGVQIDASNIPDFQNLSDATQSLLASFQTLANYIAKITGTAAPSAAGAAPRTPTVPIITGGPGGLPSIAPAAAGSVALARQLGAFASGGSFVTSGPSLFLAGEAGTERIDVTPIGSARQTGATEIHLHISGNTMLSNDQATAREIARIINPHLSRIVKV